MRPELSSSSVREAHTRAVLEDTGKDFFFFYKPCGQSLCIHCCLPISLGSLLPSQGDASFSEAWAVSDLGAEVRC